MTPEEKYEYFIRNNNDFERIIEVVTIKHSKLPEPFNLVKEPSGYTVTFEDGTVTDCQGTNMLIERANDEENLDERFTFTFDDTYGEVEDNVNLVDINDDEKFVIEYRVFVASDTSEPAIPAVRLEVVAISFNNSVASMDAQTPTLVASRTGELYTYERFPTLKSFLD